MGTGEERLRFFVVRTDQHVNVCDTVKSVLLDVRVKERLGDCQEEIHPLAS